MNKFLSIILKEFRYFVTDKGAMLIMILGVIAYSLCYAVPYYNEVVREVPISVVDCDQSNFSNKFIKDLDSTETLDIIEQSYSIQDAQNKFYKNKIKGFIVIPKDFEREILRGKQANVSVYADSAYFIVYKSVYSGVVQTAMETGKKLEAVRLMKGSIPKRQAKAIVQPFELIWIPLFNAAGGYKSYVYPIILIFILHQTLIIGLGLMQGTRNEKQKRYCEEDKDIPITLLARSTAYISFYCIYATIFFFIYPNLFEYTLYCNAFPVLILFLLMMYAAAFFGQAISYWFRTRETVILLVVAFSIILIFITGLLWPRESIPSAINLASYFIPVICGVDGIIKLNQNGASVANVLYDYFWMIFLCIFYFIMAVSVTKQLHKEFKESD